MSEDHPFIHMSLQEVQALVGDLEEKYRAWTLLRLEERPEVTRADLEAIRASLQRSLAHLDWLLGHADPP